ncbi:hypothetical protein N7452_006610 [Penicillium brevicompactum]|uniref:Uncharacterized protein n=1 Tax=Penicillium brevicompactum TaxID=5074 RepID=A0A9W9QKV8_PENBR|nr:hypothetical protein N7452_006610 [Penicillium brevicompactum]
MQRVQGSAKELGRVGVRYNPVSPGIISKAAGCQEIQRSAGKFIAASPVRRVGAPQDDVHAISVSLRLYGLVPEFEHGSILFVYKMKEVVKSRRKISVVELLNC